MRAGTEEQGSRPPTKFVGGRSSALCCSRRASSRGRLLHRRQDVLGHVLHVERLERGKRPLHVEELEHGLAADRDDEGALARLFLVDLYGDAGQSFGQPVRPGLERASALAGLDLDDGAAAGRLGGRFGLGSRGLLGRRFGLGFLGHGCVSDGSARVPASRRSLESRTSRQLCQKLGEHSLASGLVKPLASKSRGREAQIPVRTDRRRTPRKRTSPSMALARLGQAKLRCWGTRRRPNDTRPRTARARPRYRPRDGIRGAASKP